MSILLFSVLYPIGATYGIEPSGEEPTSCIESPERTVSQADSPDVIGTVSQEGGSGDIVNISYDVGEDSEDLTIKLTSAAELVNSSGFETLGPGSSSLYLNSSADSHWITYRMSSFEIASDRANDTKYPNNSDWIFATVPIHNNVNVSLEPAKSGYIGGNTLYLGDYELETREVGCQTFEVVIPKDSVPLFDAEARLYDLEVAAKNIPTDRHYETVTVFVSSEEIGDLGGFVYNHESDIVVVDSPSGFHPSIVWIHEYVHTHQHNDFDISMAWTVEASANYMAYKIALENGLISPLYYDSLLAMGDGGDWERSLDESTQEQIAYVRGATVFAQIDRDLETHSNRSMDDVFEWLNTNRFVRYSDFREYLAEEGRIPDKTIEEYDSIILENESVDPPYSYGFSNELLREAWPLLIFALSPEIRFIFSVVLAILSLILSSQYIYDWATIDPNFRIEWE